MTRPSNLLSRARCELGPLIDFIYENESSFIRFVNPDYQDISDIYNVALGSNTLYYCYCHYVGDHNSTEVDIAVVEDWLDTFDQAAA